MGFRLSILTSLWPPQPLPLLRAMLTLRTRTDVGLGPCSALGLPLCLPRASATLGGSSLWTPAGPGTQMRSAWGTRQPDGGWMPCALPV